MTRKGSLSLSINAIVVLVIGIVVLGLSLGMIRGWFGIAQKEVGGLLDVSDIKSHADASIPLRMPSEVSVDVGKTADITIAYYNRGADTRQGAQPVLGSCQIVAGTGNLPLATNLISIPTDVGGSSEQAYKAIFNAEGLTQGTYLCQISMSGTGGEGASATFTLTINP